MGIGKSFKKAVGKGVRSVSKATGLNPTMSGALIGGVLTPLTGGASLAAGTALGAGLGAAAGRFGKVGVKLAQAGATPEQITTANLFSKLSPEQQKDLLLNNPNIVGPGGMQIYDPLTNTVRIEESPFQQEQRGRQEALAKSLSSQLQGIELPGTDPSARFE